MALPDRLSEWLDADDWLAPPEPVRAAPVRAEPVRAPRARLHEPSRSSRPPGNPASSRGRSQEARRRMRLIRRRRLDLLQDAALALVLAIIVLSETAGLGVVALLAAFTTLALIASLVIERRLRRKRG